MSKSGSRGALASSAGNVSAVNASSNSAAFWSLSFFFADWNLAGRAYELSRDLIFGDGIDASTYRLLLNGKSYVVIVGSGLPDEDHVNRFSTICQHGESTDVPDEVVLTLAIRHEQFRPSGGVRFERRGTR